MQKNWRVVRGWFDFHVLSFEARSMKPDSGIYETCERRSGRRPEHLFFTDDRLENIATARARGWMGHQYTDIQLLRDCLGQWLGLNLKHPQEAKSIV